MAAVSRAAVELVPPEESASSPISSPPETFAANDDTAERADPLPQAPMKSSEIRNRGEGRAARGSTHNDGSSSGSTPTLTPSSSEAEGETQVHDRPRGYPQLATYLNSNDNWAMYRSFGNLSARTLLQLEIELTELEKKIQALDEADSADPAMTDRLIGLGESPGNNKQKENIDEARKKLCEYFDLFLHVCQVRALERPSERDYFSFVNWMWNEKPLVKGKDDFAFYAEDFVSATKHSEKRTRLGNFIETRLDRWPRLRVLFQTERERRKSRDESVHHYSEKHIEFVAKGINVCLSMGVLLVPVMILFLVEMSREWMAWLVFIFVMGFPLVMSAVMEPKAQDLLFGTAAYAAVLVTFLGNFK
ncbi:hypothetical protein G7Y89_g7942 [Cudoniella acicularis]|uniref:DUF6594 domain-containing protein n=1 Tax=Cudoniella acicularis TaxID=354080 RepID=A0A8H4RJJ8_9HELO|nr:hypothetical protein G7Y89_g7942 [Cudoniella acicularis]